MSNNGKGLRQKEERLGEIKRNKESLGRYEMKIIEYKSYSDITIEFQDKQKAVVHTAYNNFQKGNVKNPYHPSVYGIGYIGQGKYKVAKNDKITKPYQTWKGMLERCYDEKRLKKQPTYTECIVCEEWLCFQNFAEWYCKNYYECNGETMHLDKDILYKGNKIYSPETCMIVPERINEMFVKSDAIRGSLPIGCNKKGNKICVRCQILNKRKHLGYFPLNRPFQAFTIYKEFKENYIKQVADEYKDLIPQKLYDAMYEYKIEIND